MSEYNFSGDYTLDTLELVTKNGTLVDLRLMYEEFSLFESLFDNAVTGVITISDSLDMLSKLKITTGETININFYTGGKDFDPIEGQFIIYKISDVENINLSHQIYKFYITTVEYIKNQYNYLGNGFTGTTSDIANLVHDKLNTEKDFNWEPTKGLINFVSPQWNPFKILNWLCKRSLNDKNEAGFIFFENNKGYNFTSIHTLYNQDPIRFYKQQSGNNPKEQLNKKSESYFNIINLSTESSTDLLTKLNDGSYGSTTKSLDLTTREFSFDEFSTDNEWKIGSDHLRHVIVQSGYSNEQYEDNKDKVIAKHQSSLKLLDEHSVVIDVVGDSELYCGASVEISILHQEAHAKELKKKKISGVYIIGQLRHTINKERYIQTQRLFKSQ